MTRPALPRLRLSLWLLVFYVTLAGFWLIIFNWHQTKELESLERAWQTAGWRQAALLAHLVTPAFQSGDLLLLRQTVINLAADEHLPLIILDVTGATLARAPESALTPVDLADRLRQRVLASGQPEMQTGQTPHDQYYAMPVPASSGGVGAVVVTENNWEAEYAAAQRGSWLELGQTLLVIVLGICLLAVWTSAALRPIARLHELTRATAAGRWERRAYWRSSVLEFDDLLVAFNQMLTQLTRERTDREMVEAGTRRQAAAFAALHHVGLELGRQLDLPSLLRAIVAQAVHLFEAPMGGLYLLLPDEQTLELAVSFTHPTDFTGLRLRLGEGLAGHVAQTGEPMVVDDYGAWPGHATAFGDPPFRSVMQAPIKWRNRVVGVISVDDARPHRFDAEALNLLALFADQAAVAIANARLFQNLAEEKNRIELLYTLSQRLNAQLDLQEVSDRSLELTMRALNVNNGNLWLLDDASEHLSLLSAYRQGQPLVPLPAWGFNLGEGLAGQALLQRKPLVSADVRADARWVVIPGEDEAVRSAVSVPMWAGETPVGVISLRSERENYFAQLDAPLLMAAATSVGFALQNARLFSETRRRGVLEHEQRTLAEAMRDTVATLNSTLNLDEVLDRVLLNLDQVVPYEGADVMLVENGLGRVVRWHRRPEYERADWLRGLQMPVADYPILRQMLATSQPVRFEDTQADPRWVRLTEDTWVRSYLGVPICLRGEVVGFLNLSSTQPGFFTEAHERNLQTFAHQVAVALDNARLYQLAQASARTAEEAAAESARLYRASAQLLALSGDLHDMARHIVRIVMDEFSAAHCGVLVLDEAATELRLLAQGGLYEMPLNPLPLNGRGLVAAAARTGAAIYAPEVSQDERYYPGTPSTRSELALPLHVADRSRANGERVIGVLNLESSERDAFDERARRGLAAFAEQSALALENAQLLTRLHLARFMAEEANQLKSQFLANTSHELRTPLTGIIGALSLILEGLCDSPAEEREFLQVAYGASRNLLAIVNDVLDIAKIEAGKMEVEAQPVLLSALFDEIGALLRVQADEKRLRLNLAPPPTDTPVYADPAKVRQILINLMSNALKFTERGSISLRAYADPLRRQMVVDVQDTGIGISPEKQGKLFQPFVQADGSMTRQYGGTGLGLSISRSLAELMGGTLTLFSAGEGQGSTFTLRLPFAAPPRGE